MNLVHVIDDDPDVLDGLVMLFNSEGLEVRAYADADAFAAGMGAAEPGCVVTDLRMPGMDGIGLLRCLRGRADDFRVIVLTGRADVPAAVEALTGGAIDLLEKPVQPEILSEKVKAALAGLEAHRRTALERQEARDRFDALTAREKEVLDQLLVGASSKEAAITLGISPRTIETYRGNIMMKTSAQSLAQLIRLNLLAQDKT